MTLQDFCDKYRVNKKTVLNRLDSIPGISYQEGEWSILEGTRYPYDKRHLKKKSMNNRSNILKAISEDAYIDYKMLKIDENIFQSLINDLLELGYIRENMTKNPYGANAFDATFQGEEVLKKNKWEELEKICGLVGYTIGASVAAFNNYSK